MAEEFEFTSEEDKVWIDELLDGFVNEDCPLLKDLDEEEQDVLLSLATELVFGEDESIFEIIAENDYFFYDRIHHPTVKRLLFIALNVGIAQNNGDCANYLGALYYTGHGVEEDVEKAAEYYDMGMEWGSSQAAVNLGYCYYYGRLGDEVDYEKAYQYFTRGVMMDGNPDGLTKIANMYAGGRYLPKDECFAFDLYLRAYDVTKDTPGSARPAHHLADYFMSGIEGYVDRDPHRALILYQIAERYYYQSIATGLGYYRKHLQAAIDGQQAARELIHLSGEEF